MGMCALKRAGEEAKEALMIGVKGTTRLDLLASTKIDASSLRSSSCVAHDGSKLLIPDPAGERFGVNIHTESWENLRCMRGGEAWCVRLQVRPLIGKWGSAHLSSVEDSNLESSG